MSDSSAVPRPPGHSSPITLYPAWCKRCGICIAFCPKSVFDTAVRDASLPPPSPAPARAVAGSVKATTPYPTMRPLGSPITSPLLA